MHEYLISMLKDMAISSELLFLKDFKRDLIMTFISFFYFFREKNIVWTKDYQSTQILIACYTEKGRMLKEISLVNVHWLFQNEPVFPELAVLWAAATFCSPQVNHMHCMWFSRNQKLYKENCFNSLKKSKKMSQNP